MTLSDRKVIGAGFQLTIKSGTVSKKVQDSVLEGLTEISKNYVKQVDKNLSLDDHTLEQLREMGHPYSVDKPTNTPHDDRMIHEQSGKLRNSIKMTEPKELSSRRYSVLVTTNDPAAVDLIYGTARMRPRRFHEKSFEDIKAKFWEPLVRRLKGIKYKISATESVKGNS